MCGCVVRSGRAERGDANTTQYEMASLLRALRENAHALNYVLIATAALVPVVAYAQLRAPTSVDIEHHLVRGRGRERDAHTYAASRGAASGGCGA